jgi:hypothetical protein
MLGPPGNNDTRTRRRMSAKTANKNNQPTMAEKADIHELYELSVQNVEGEVEFLQETFKNRKHVT